VLLAREQGLANFSIVSNQVTVPAAVRALLDAPETRLDAFIAPGHVSLVTGSRPYGFMAADYGKPVVISGFEPTDLLQATLMILRQQREGRCTVENQYRRAVAPDGNPRA
ncbi:MAG: hydrogenase formation protein HypD, partial [Gammaproteobacteria bacterium]|nr:hydrogenase formation protein HypD [Gammaproteobacteria bacterium]